MTSLVTHELIRLEGNHLGLRTKIKIEDEWHQNQEVLRDEHSIADLKRVMNRSRNKLASFVGTVLVGSEHND